jgi:hypothetical protein
MIKDVAAWVCEALVEPTHTGQVLTTRSIDKDGAESEKQITP